MDFGIEAQEAPSEVDPYALASVPVDDQEMHAEHEDEPAPENYDLNALTQIDGPANREFDYFATQDHFNPIDESSEGSERQSLGSRMIDDDGGEDDGRSDLGDLINLFHSRGTSALSSGVTTRNRNSAVFGMSA